VIRRLERPVPEGIEAGELLEVLASEGAPLLAEGLLALAAGEQPLPQTAEGAPLAPKLRSSDAVIDWTADAGTVARLIRSVTPRPGAATFLADERVKLAGVTLDADSPSSVAPLEPGVVTADGQGISVACGTGAVRIERIQFPGRPWSSTADQVRGRRLATGMVLGPQDGPT